MQPTSGYRPRRASGIGSTSENVSEKPSRLSKQSSVSSLGSKVSSGSRPGSGKAQKPPLGVGESGPKKRGVSPRIEDASNILLSYRSNSTATSVESANEDLSTLSIEAICTKLLDLIRPVPQRLMYVHHLNQRFAAAPNFKQCMELVNQLPSEIVPELLSLVSRGEPQVYICLNLLHFAAFHPPLRGDLIDAQALPVLLGLVRSKAERELSHAALSLMVTLVQDAEGIRELGSMRGVGGLAASLLLPPASLDTRSLALHLLRALLRSAGGRQQACSSNKLHKVLEQALQQDRLESEKEQLKMVQRELDFYRENYGMK